MGGILRSVLFEWLVCSIELLPKLIIQRKRIERALLSERDIRKIIGAEQFGTRQTNVIVNKITFVSIYLSMEDLRSVTTPPPWLRKICQIHKNGRVRQFKSPWTQNFSENIRGRRHIPWKKGVLCGRL